MNLTSQLLFVRAMQCHLKLTLLQRIILIHLADLSASAGLGDVSVDYLMSSFGISAKQAVEAFRTLRDAGHILVRDGKIMCSAVASF